MQTIHLILAVVHAVAGAGWLGAMIYSYAVLHPKARGYFREREEFERFIATMAQGARWKVLGAFGVMLASGVGLLVLDWGKAGDGTWRGLMAAKVVLFAAALVVFCYVSWVMWPRRIFAVEEEIEGMQRRFRWVARVMIGLVGASFVLGVMGQS